MRANACGVDFGTSNSTVGWLRPDADVLLALANRPVCEEIAVKPRNIDAEG